MTNREEAILGLKELRDWEGLPYCIEEPMQREGVVVITQEVIDTAIKALEQKDVVDKIKAEIIEKFDNCNICEWFEDYDYDENDISEYRWVGHISDIIDIIDKYRK